MTFAAQPTSRRPAGRGFALLVLVLLAGVLGMHALSPSPAAARPAAAAQAAHAGHATAAVHAAAAPVSASAPAVDRDRVCSHTDGGSGHLGHADATCAAAGIGSAYAPPALTAALAGAGPEPVHPGAVPASAATDRAPPDLAELQLLRI
ncbi:DUF6153 family protein [Streptomyces sp. NPDC090445]|uniref:DUF6153 family protein n=1 Tax=Streptomyces sp. NPDC090445 TaxID=3365963 RepID=UPI003813D9F1